MNTIIYRVSDVAKALNLSTRRVQQLAQQGILSDSRKGKYNLAACMRAYEKHLQEKEEKGISHSEIAQQKLRLLRAQAEKAELELEALKGKYVEASEVEFEWTDLIIKFRTRMLAIPAKLVRALAAAGGDFAAMEKILEDEIYDALTELGKYDDEEEAEHQEAQAQTNA